MVAPGVKQAAKASQWPKGDCCPLARNLALPTPFPCESLALTSRLAVNELGACCWVHRSSLSHMEAVMVFLPTWPVSSHGGPAHLFCTTYPSTGSSCELCCLLE